MLVKYYDIQEFKYHVNLIFDIILNFIVINSFPEQNNLESKSSFLVLTIAIFAFCYCWLQGLGLSKSLQSCLALPILFFLNIYNQAFDSLIQNVTFYNN